ncbi:MAG: hypothetical protein KDD25_05145 [Bdellovibrionales bacterium]|nr:hypothetical protein [Bdellovibrionales bacterium]
MDMDNHASESNESKKDGFQGWENSKTLFSDQIPPFLRPDFDEKNEDLNFKRVGTYGLEYEIKKNRIVEKHGDLDSIRKKLGLSQRQICRELFVDPSAWSRWTKAGSDAPPHIYRTLDLLLSGGEAIEKRVEIRENPKFMRSQEALLMKLQTLMKWNRRWIVFSIGATLVALALLIFR